MFWCANKGVYLSKKKAIKKCIGVNLRKRHRICPHLKEVVDEDSYPHQFVPYRHRAE